MQHKAKLTQMLPIQNDTLFFPYSIFTCTSFETDVQYPQKVCVSIWGYKVNEGQLQIGKILKIDFDIESSGYKSKWYTEIKSLKIEEEGTSIQNNSDVIPNINFFF